ncbi:hypothetical protein [Pseudonocardia sp. ICBG601]|uniref:hypothetical protein n=1 Tax=Pseudonocardia sp. ICBG601 TaxID=2846759 RepID=UPI001CF6E91C|nr:hypothetical protein [Pseudonocardia sp. ICBG601]
MTRTWTVLFTVLAAAVFVLVEIWAFREETAVADAGTSATTSTTVPSEMVTASGPVDLSALRIAPDRHGRDYRREAFGPGWAPAVGPGCDVRDAVLARDLVDTTVKNGCDVTAGTLYDPYSGQTVTGPTRDLDVDHVIPLALAHRSGAHAWTDQQRDAFRERSGQPARHDRGDQPVQVRPRPGTLDACGRRVRLRPRLHPDRHPLPAHDHRAARGGATAGLSMTMFCAGVSHHPSGGIFRYRLVVGRFSGGGAGVDAI